MFPDFKDWPLLKFSDDRSNFAYELTNKVVKQIANDYDDNLHELIEKTIYLEKLRIKNNPWKVDPKDDEVYWNKLESSIQNTSLEKNKELYLHILKKIIDRYTEEILGHFQPKAHLFARKFLYRLFNVIYNKSFVFVNIKSQKLKRKLHLNGHVDEVRNLFDKGTIVFLPTHFSNLDSILLGFIMDTVAGLPANSCGAGLNLYDYEIPAYYMSRLGAYKVDRRKKNMIYQKTLLTMSSLSLIKGVNSMFFPGGARSRSGSIENKLKLGLLRSLIEAQWELMNEQSSKKIIIVPVTFGYHSVFEAKSLIEQHLRAEGKSKYLRSKRKDKKSYLGFIKKLWTNESEVYLRFGKPMDVLGYELNADAKSIDANGDIVNVKGYFEVDGKIERNTQREHVYTRKLAEKLIESFHVNNIILSSQLVAYICFVLLKEHHPDKDVYAIVNTPIKDFYIPYDDFYSRIDKIKNFLLSMVEDDKFKLEPIFWESTDDLIHKGLKHINAFHKFKPVYLDKSKGLIKSEDFKLLYYYHNKLDGYDFDKLMQSYSD